MQSKRNKIVLAVICCIIAVFAIVFVTQAVNKKKRRVASRHNRQNNAITNGKPSTKCVANNRSGKIDMGKQAVRQFKCRYKNGGKG